MAIATTAQLTIVTRMYTALFNRAPDTAGLSFWANAMANGASQATVTQGFLAAPEGVAQYPAFQTASAFVTAFYTKVFGRTPDAGGLAFWVAALNNLGGVESASAKAALATQIIDLVSTPLSAADAALAANAQTVADRAIFANKVDLGLYLASNSTVTVAGANNLQGVTASPSSIDAAKGAVFQNLVTGTANITGTDSADFISATVAQLNNTATRVFDGGAGIDTLNLSSVGDASLIRAGSVTNIELVKLSGVTSGSVNATDAFVGSTSITLDGANVGTITGLSGKTLGFSGATNVSTIGADFGTAATAAIALANTVSAGNATTLNLTGAALTTASVTGSGNLTLGATATNAALLKTVNVTAATGSTITINTLATAAALTTVDASTSTGNVTAILGTSGYKGGSGVDTVTLAAATTKVVDGGAGTSDVLIVNAGSDILAASVGNVTGFETVSLGANATGTVTLGAAFQQISIENAVAAGVTFANVAAGVNLTLKASNVADITYTLGTNTAADAITVNLTGTATTGALTGNKLTATSVETVNIVTSNTGSAAATTVNALTLVDAAVKAIVVTGNAGINLASDATNLAITSFDATAVTGPVTFALAAPGSTTQNLGIAVSIKGSLTGVNNLSGFNSNDTIVGGAANDTITSGAGLDILTGGGGNDTFVINARSANVSTFSTITDFNKGDKIDVSAIAQGTLAVAASLTKVGLSAGTFAQFVAAASGVDGSTNAAASWFQSGGDTYIVIDNAASTTAFVDGTDQIIKLTGLVDLAGASIIAGEVITIA